MAGVVVVFRKKNGTYEVYSSVKCFTEHNPSYKAGSLWTNLQRKRKSKKETTFEDEDILLKRLPIIGRIAQRNKTSKNHELQRDYNTGDRR